MWKSAVNADKNALPVFVKVVDYGLRRCGGQSNAVYQSLRGRQRRLIVWRVLLNKRQAVLSQLGVSLHQSIIISSLLSVKQRMCLRQVAIGLLHTCGRDVLHDLIKIISAFDVIQQTVLVQSVDHALLDSCP